MTRRDMIIIAALVNVGVLAIIFMTAIGFDDDHLANNQTSTEALAEASKTPEPIEAFTQVQDEKSPFNKTVGGDEVDRVLDMYAAHEGTREGSSETLIVATPTEDAFEVASAPTPTTQTKEVSRSEDESVQYVEVTVKKGDFLDKIARANGTTADKLIQINHLPNDRIDIGQVLKVPVSNAKKVASNSATTTKKADKKKESAKTTAVSNTEAEYYTVKSGDNPWKIARQFHVKFEDLLKLNHLDEEKAKNLKVGDKIRVK